MGPDATRIAWSVSGSIPARVRYRVVEPASGSTPGEELAGSDGRVKLTGLPASATVEYDILLNGETGGPSFRFRTAPPTGARTRFRFFVWGDSGSGTEAQIELGDRIAERHRDRPFDFALHTGDLAYPNATRESLTERHFRVYREWLGALPVYPVPGNHDVAKDGGRAFDEAFLAPRGIDPGRRYYSFDYGNAHIIALDSNQGNVMEAHGGDLRDPRSPQRAWLEQDLAAASSDPRIDWIIVLLHHPPYSAARGLAGHGSDRALRESLIPLFDRFGVDLVFSGHDHNYERTHPLRGDARADRGTVYIVTGGGGGPRAFRDVGRQWWTAQYGRFHHFVAAEIVGETLEAEVIDRRGDVVDRFRLTPRRAACQNCTPVGKDDSRETYFDREKAGTEDASLVEVVSPSAGREDAGAWVHVMSQP